MAIESAGGRARAGAAELALAAELIRSLWLATRRGAARSLAQGVDPNDIDEAWCRAAGCFDAPWTPPGEPAAEPPGLTSKQRSEVARKVRAIRRAANAKSKHLAKAHADLAEECRLRAAEAAERLAALKAEQAKSPFAGSRKEVARLGRQKANLLSRARRMEASSRRHAALAKAGNASVCFGGKRLASQRHLAGTPGAAFATAQAWRQAWEEARLAPWTFEGCVNYKDANPEVKWDPITQVATIRLTDSQARRRMAARAAELGLPLVELLEAKKWSSERMACRQLSLPLNLLPPPGAKGKAAERRRRRAGRLVAALTPLGLPKTRDAKGVLSKDRHRTPVSWTLRIEGGSIWLEASWEGEAIARASGEDAGCLGVDLNCWGLAWAACDRTGNKPSGKGKTTAEGEEPQPFHGKVAIGWPEPGAKGANKAKTLARQAAAKLVAIAKARRLPIALELLDFRGKRAGLRHLPPKLAARLSGFAYRSLTDAIASAAERAGVELRFVDPAWTSKLGWAKYGAQHRMDPDSAAAFAIARAGRLPASRLGPAQGKLATRQRAGERVALRSVRESVPPALLAALAKKKAKATPKPKPAASPPAASNQQDQTKQHSAGPATAAATGRQRSMPAGASGCLKRLAEALGDDRRLWQGNLSRLLRPAGNPLRTPHGLESSPRARGRGGAGRLAAGPGGGGAHHPPASTLCVNG